MADGVTKFVLAVIRQTVEPLLNGLILICPLNSVELPVPFPVRHDSTKLGYINKNILTPIAITSILMYIVNRYENKRPTARIGTAGLSLLWGYPRGGGHRRDKQARRRFNSD
jgi:hypothetical protein